VVLQTRNTRDDDSAEMLDIIRQTKYYSYAGFTNPRMNNIALEVVIDQKGTNFASFFAKHEAAAKLELVKLAKIIQDNR